MLLRTQAPSHKTPERGNRRETLHLSGPICLPFFFNQKLSVLLQARCQILGNKKENPCSKKKGKGEWKQKSERWQKGPKRVGLYAGDHFKTGRGIQRGSLWHLPRGKGAIKEGKEGVTRLSLEDKLGGMGTPSSKILLVYSSILLRVEHHLSCGPSGRLDQSPSEACHFKKKKKTYC